MSQPIFVTPAQAGVPLLLNMGGPRDARLCWSDGK